MDLPYLDDPMIVHHKQFSSLRANTQDCSKKAIGVVCAEHLILLKVETVQNNKYK